jgi:hypothetical protein
VATIARGLLPGGLIPAAELTRSRRRPSTATANA